MPPPHNNGNGKKIGVRLAWWHPEEFLWLIRSRSIMPHYQNNDNYKNGVLGWYGVTVKKYPGKVKAEA